MNNGHHEHETNPWIVTKIQDFLYFCCPECDVREPINSKEDFFKHAIENHPKAKYYLEELIKNEPDNLELGGDENNWHFDEYHTSDFLEGDNKPITEDFYVEENGNEIITTAGDCAKVKGEEIQNNASNFEIDNIEISNNDFNNDETTCDDLLLNNVKCELKEDEFIENIIAEHQNVISEEKLSNYYKYKKQKECEVCHKVFSDGACLRRHIRTVHEGQKYNCELCEKSFSQLPNLKIHISTVHDEDGTSTNKWREKYEKNRTPQECNNKDSTVLRRHIKAVHEKFETQSKMVHEDNKAHLNDHVTAYHDKPKDFFKCEFCDDKFQKLSVLKIHCIEIHDKQKFLKCDKCGKEFSQSQSLKEHVLFVHEGIKNHVCDSCGKAFGTSSVLKHHQKVVCNFLSVYNKKKPCKVQYDFNISFYITGS